MKYVPGACEEYNKTQKVALPKVMTPHTLRHTFCTTLANAGMNPSIAVHHGTFQHQYDAELLRAYDFRNVDNRNEAADCISR